MGKKLSNNRKVPGAAAAQNKQAKLVCQRGLRVGSSAVTTLGDPAKEFKDLKVEDDFSLKVMPVLPALNCALLEAQKSFTEEGICPNTFVKHNFQELYKVDQSPSLTAASQDGLQETASTGQLSSGFDLASQLKSAPYLTQLKSYFFRS
ncbi:Protein TASOR 2 [Manis javanica]|nr:Protein TASOR 2 [Manis javanica]